MGTRCRPIRKPSRRRRCHLQGRHLRGSQRCELLRHRHDIGDLEFLDFEDHFGFASDVDVDFEEVSEDSDLEDECFLTDIEGDGDLEFTCFVEDDD